MSETQDILNSVDTLAPMPNTAVRLMRVINDPHASVENIIDGSVGPELCVSQY